MIYPEITLEEYEQVRQEVAEEIRSHRPFVFFQNDPQVYPKTKALKLIARHLKWSERDVYTFLGQHKDQIRTLLTEKPVCPPHWSHEEIVSYANIVIRVINENERM